MRNEADHQTLDLITYIEAQPTTQNARAREAVCNLQDALPEGMLDQLRQYKYEIIEYLSQKQYSTQAQAANDVTHDDGLSISHKRALKGFYYTLGKKQQNLIKRGYNVQNATVSLEEWLASIMRVIGLSYQEAEQVKDDLIQAGYLAYHSDLKTKLIEGDGQIAGDISQVVNAHYLPLGITGQDFREWLYGSDSLH
jgi:hypothetical protein